MPNRCSCTTVKNTQCSFRSRKKYCGHHKQCKLAWDVPAPAHLPAPNKSKASSFVTICRRYLMNPDKPLGKIRIRTTWLHNKHNSNLFIIRQTHGIREEVECASVFDAVESIFNENHKLSSPETIDMFTEDSDWGFKIDTKEEAMQFVRFKDKYRPCFRARNCLDNTVRFHFAAPVASSDQAWMDRLNDDFIIPAILYPEWDDLPDLIRNEFTCENDLQKLLTTNQYVVQEAKRAGIDMALLLKYFHMILEFWKKTLRLDWKSLIVVMSRFAVEAYTTCRIVKYSKCNTIKSVKYYPEMCGLLYAGESHAMNVREMLLDPLIGFSEVTRVI